MSRKNKCASSHTRMVPLGDRFGRPSGVTVAAKQRCGLDHGPHVGVEHGIFGSVLCADVVGLDRAGYPI
jgi:hypothetical protein